MKYYLRIQIVLVTVFSCTTSLANVDKIKFVYVSQQILNTIAIKAVKSPNAIVDRDTKVITIYVPDKQVEYLIAIEGRGIYSAVIEIRFIKSGDNIISKSTAWTIKGNRKKFSAWIYSISNLITSTAKAGPLRRRIIKLCNDLEKLRKTYPEVGDTDTVESINKTLNYYFVWGKGGTNFPRYHAMFTIEGNRVVSHMINSFIVSANKIAKEQNIPLGNQRRLVLTDETIRTTMGDRTDSFIGESPSLSPPIKPHNIHFNPGKYGLYKNIPHAYK